MSIGVVAFVGIVVIALLFENLNITFSDPAPNVCCPGDVAKTKNFFLNADIQIINRFDRWEFNVG
jgi:hypothetical protein